MNFLFCPVCYAPTDAIVRESLNLGILVLLGVTAVVLAGVARFILSIAQHDVWAHDHVLCPVALDLCSGRPAR